MSPTVHTSSKSESAVSNCSPTSTLSDDNTVRSVSPLAPHSSPCPSPSPSDTGTGAKLDHNRVLARVSHEQGGRTKSKTLAPYHHSNRKRYGLTEEIELLNRSSSTLRQDRFEKPGYFHLDENDYVNIYRKKDIFIEYNRGDDKNIDGIRYHHNRDGYINPDPSHQNGFGSWDKTGLFPSKNDIDTLNAVDNSNVSNCADENSIRDQYYRHGEPNHGVETNNVIKNTSYFESPNINRVPSNTTRKKLTTLSPNRNDEKKRKQPNIDIISFSNDDDPKTENDVFVQQNHKQSNVEISKIMTPTSEVPSTTNMNGTMPPDCSGDSDATSVDMTLKDSQKRCRRTLDPDHVSHQFFHLEPCLYTHRMFQRAARIFSVLKHDDADTEEKKALRRRNGEAPTTKEKIPDMDFIDSQEQIKTFELTFATLKFQKLFSCILDYIGFFYKYTELNDHYSLVYVVLHDLQTRKFQRRIPFPDEVLDPVCVDVEEALLCEKTKLQANIAKERIKNNAPSVDFLLPEHVRNKDETKSKTPVYMWVNQMKTTVDNTIANLKAENFQLMESGTDMSEVTHHAFLIDPHCSDMLTFPPHLNMELKSSEMVKSGHLVQQDKSSCLAPQTVTHLLGNDHDVIHVNIGTAMTTCHIASLLRHKSPHSHIWAFGVDSPQKITKVMKTMEFLEVKNVKIVQEEFLNIDPEDSKFKGVRVILISANCSKSAITSPVQFIVSEGEDTQILGELSVGEADMNHVRDLMVDHERLLKHALKFPKLQAVVYTTRSRFELENELVVNRVLEFINATNNKRNIFKISPPVLPFQVDEINTGKGGVDGRYLRFLPSDKANGCFVAIIAREPEESKESKSSDKKKSKLGKSKSAQSAMQGSSGGQKNRKPLKGTASLPENVGNGIDEEDVDSPRTPKSKGSGSGLTVARKLSSHKSAAAPGARLYQQGVIKKMEKARLPPTKPEHLKVVKHPAPFREDEKSPSRAKSRTPRSHSGSRFGRDTANASSSGSLPTTSPEDDSCVWT